MAEQNLVRKGGLSGRIVVTALVAATIVSLLIGIPTTFRFAAAQDTLEAARQSWPKAYSELVSDYRAIESELSRNESEAQIHESLADKIATFENAVLYTEQLPIAIEIETDLQRLSQEGSRDFVRSARGEGVANYLEKESELAATRRGVVGVITYSLLRLQTLPELSESLAK